MKYLFLTLFILLTSCSFVKYSVFNCTDNDKMEFIEKLIAAPDSYLNILDSSKYDKSKKKYSRRSGFPKYIKEYFSCGAEFYLIDYYAVSQVASNELAYLVEIYIYKSNCNDKFITFEFYSDDDSDDWHLNVIYYKYFNRAAGDRPEIADDCDDEES
jgi:hypothetical protein